MALYIAIMDKFIVLAICMILGTINCLKCLNEATSGELLLMSELYINCIPDRSIDLTIPGLESSEEMITSSPDSFFDAISRKRRSMKESYGMENDLIVEEYQDQVKNPGWTDWGCAFHCMMKQEGLINPYNDKPDQKIMGKYISAFNDTEMRDFIFQSSNKCFNIIDRDHEKCDFTMEIIECIWTRMGANCE